MFPNMSINGAHRVIQEINVGVGEHGTRKRDTLFLSAGEVDALLPDDCTVAMRENKEIGTESARVDDCVVLRFVVF